MWTRKELKDSAKEAIGQNYGMTVAALFVFSMIISTTTTIVTYAVMFNLLARKNIFMFGITQFIGILVALFKIFLVICFVNLVIYIFVSSPFSVGLLKFFTNNQDGNGDIANIFWPFSRLPYYCKCTGVMLLMYIKIFLWSFLLIIPGIMKFYEYRMVPYILFDNPELSVREIFSLSKEMTYGEKMDIFLLDLSFVGWYLLLWVPLISLLWVMPYQLATNAELYLTLREKVEYADSEPEEEVLE